jgi:hypothetical protein
MIPRLIHLISLGKYLIAAVREGGHVCCDHWTHNFPTLAIEVARSRVEGEFEKLTAENA